VPLLFGFYVITLVETFNTSGGIHHAAFAGEEGMAITADFNLEFLLGGAGGELIAAGTDYLGVSKVFGMNLFFHIV
jgi:hypothetical protein